MFCTPFWKAAKHQAPTGHCIFWTFWSNLTFSDPPREEAAETRRGGEAMSSSGIQAETSRGSAQWAAPPPFRRGHQRNRELSRNVLRWVSQENAFPGANRVFQNGHLETTTYCNQLDNPAASIPANFLLFFIEESRYEAPWSPYMTTKLGFGPFPWLKGVST